jgi:hypothetical protein
MEIKLEIKSEADRDAIEWSSIVDVKRLAEENLIKDDPDYFRVNLFTNFINMQNEKLEQLSRRIIELIRGKTYDEALSKDNPGFYSPNPITIGRVMEALCSIDCQALLNKGGGLRINTGGEYDIPITVCWQLTKENGQECDLSDQTEDTINKLYEIII